MSALTFKDLSAELTQAIESQLDTPSGTQARCTLGREKVMVLVEYPTEVGQSEPLADSTLDWLEQSLRQQFDTVGLPEEAADLSETGDAVAVQLFLKHHSEPKPFTARSFTWKVADGFNDLFGEPIGDSEEPIKTPTPAFQDATGSLSSPEAEAEAEAAHAFADIRPDIRPLESELDTGLEDAFLPISAIEDLDSEIFSLPGDEFTADLDASDLDLPTVDLPIAYAGNSDLSDEGFFELEPSGVSSPSGASDSELATDFENALDQSAAQLTDNEADSEIEFAEDIFSELLDSEFPDSEFPDSENVTAEYLQHSEAETWQEPLGEASQLKPETVQTNDRPKTSTTQSAGDAPKAIVSLKDPFDNNRPIELSGDDSFSGDLSSDDDRASNERFSESASDDDLAGDWIPDISSREDEAEPGEDIFAAIADETEPGEDIFESSEGEFDAYGSDDYDADDYDADDYDADEFGSNEYTTDEYETTEDGETSEEERYQLALASEEDAPYEAVALVDEREVQKQGEQWQQQTKGNLWFFAGAIGFVVIGLFGFVLTRPCSFGACPRIKTAQAEGERALSDLTLEADLKAVTAAKQRLNQSVRSLQPIPFWSPHYSEANAILPKFEGQLTALDRVSAAQSQAYEAALASQNPPHSSAKWEEIVEQWRGAIAILENVPTDNQVRRLADRKLTEYRANLSTIKVRIDAESQAEASLLAAQKAATLATATANQASSIETWESALQNWESAVQQIDQIPQGTLAYKEAQGLQAEYRQQMEIVRDRTLKERNASRNLSKAQQLASDAERVASENQWTVAVQTWTAAVKQIQDIGPGTAAHTVAQPLVGLYQQSLAKADSNRQVSLRFQPVEPSFYAACGATVAQRCTYSIRGGNVRLNLSKDYDRAINQSITPPDQRSEINIDSGVVTQSNQLLKEITLLSTQGNFPIELYDAKGEFLARYRPDLSGFVKDQKTET
ncbi:MAG: hypothetical protein DCF25_06910 [Leptolyngbya foveolarum]|uniref:Uncharacterized protein n=1 Tax=Leptolyngbya foveolarum TaxID=47253 RepID=A0A2W4UT99_9CYAN|nr:MAG: hypothetical protein DCF25_06910 [Leptolyngbya foveolarum]